MPSHTVDERKRKRQDRRGGLLGVGDAISGARERAGEAIRGLPGKLLGGARAVDRAMITAGEQPVEAVRAFSLLGGVEGAAEAPGLFREGKPGQGLMALAGALPGVPSIRGLRAMGLFGGIQDVKGLRVFARSEGPGVRSVASITPNPKPGGKVKATIFEDTAGQGPVLSNTVDFDTVEEAAEAVGGGRGFFKGFNEVRVGPEGLMEAQFDRQAERVVNRATRAAGQAPGPGPARLLAEQRRAPGGVGGFFNLP